MMGNNINSSHPWLPGGDYYQTALDNFPDIVIILNCRLELEYLNRIGLEIYKTDIVRSGFTIKELFPDADDLPEKLMQLKSGRFLSNYEIINSRGDGKKYSFVSAGIFKDCITGEEKYLLFVKDMTSEINEFAKQIKSNIELINSNEMLKKKYADLIIENRMSSIGQLSAGIAHEINNPLGYIKSNFNVLTENIEILEKYISLLKSSSLNSEITEFADKNNIQEIFDDLEDIRKETNHGISKIKTIIDSLGSFSHTNILEKYEQVNINDSIENMLVITENQYKYDIEVIYRPGQVQDTYCMVSEINQAFLNIFMNAVENTRKSKSEKIIIIETWMSDNMIYISFENHGDSVDEADLEKVFNPFFTTKKTGEGMGLGLTIVQDIIRDRHQGSIVLTNTDNGVCVKASIPVIEYSEDTYGT